jgi:hypothetical protein
MFLRLFFACNANYLTCGALQGRHLVVTFVENVAPAHSAYDELKSLVKDFKGDDTSQLRDAIAHGMGNTADIWKHHYDMWCQQRHSWFAGTQCLFGCSLMLARDVLHVHHVVTFYNALTHVQIEILAEKGVAMIREVQIAKAIEKGSYHELVLDGTGTPYLEWFKCPPFPPHTGKPPCKRPRQHGVGSTKATHATTNDDVGASKTT